MSETLPTSWRLRALGACALLPPLISIVSFRRLASLVGRRPGQSAPSAPPDSELGDYVARVLRRLPPPWRYTCLRRSLVLYHLLRRGGRPVSLHIGVRKGPSGDLQAHAWLVKDGAPYLEPDRHEHQAFSLIASFPEPDREGS